MIDIIRKKRDRQELTQEEIHFFVDRYAKGDVPDYQASALTMAIYLNGMTVSETVAMTNEMLYSGDVLDWSSLPGKKVDKHSTGGVGDKTSLILAPIVAAAGVYVPMISGRGLGHTGGTLDKLESIPGFNVRLSAEQFEKVLSETHLALAGQTGEIAPADKKLYALRDVTSTVESIPLITSSILSKKLAEGIDGLVLDVKVGSGAFMKNEKDALALAESLQTIGTQAGKKVIALITDMEQPLGTHVGNSLEVIESVEVLRGKVENDLSQLSFELAAHMLLLGEAADSFDQAMKKVKELVKSGAAFEKFKEVVSAQDGDPQALDDYSRLPGAQKTEVVKASHAGYVEKISAEEVGVAGMLLGAGRRKVDDQIDHGVGLILHAKVGDQVKADEELATLYYNDEDKLSDAKPLLESAFGIGDKQPPQTEMVRKIIS
jgi:pyrimidine-nucleoside phosphorylase/thymidine phosphorylase